MILENNDYKYFLIHLKEEILQARNNALKSVNKELINMYWNIGTNILEKQEKSKWGDDVIGILSKDLQQEFGKGFSKRNLFRMVKFSLSYKENQKVAPLVAQISWSNNILILEKCENDFQREYYLKLSKKLPDVKK